jgi:hypothetical protein
MPPTNATARRHIGIDQFTPARNARFAAFGVKSAPDRQNGTGRARWRPCGRFSPDCKLMSPAPFKLRAMLESAK